MEKSINIDNLNINYKTFGKGVDLLVLHGWGGSSDSYIEFGKHIEKMGFRAIVPDLPGFGKSDAPKEPWTVNDYVQFARLFVKSLGMNKFLLFGHSFGGGIAAKWMSENPAEISGLVLCAPAIIRDKKTFKKSLFKFIAKTGRGFLNISKSQKLHSIGKKALYKIAREHDYEKASGVMQETFKNAVSEDLLSVLQQIKKPTLIAWGRGDKYTPISESEFVKKAIPNSKLVIFEKARHGIHLQEPKKLSLEIKNWSKNI